MQTICGIFRAIWLNVIGIGGLLLVCAYGGLGREEEDGKIQKAKY